MVLLAIKKTEKIVKNVDGVALTLLMSCVIDLNFRKIKTKVILADPQYTSYT